VREHYEPKSADFGKTEQDPLREPLLVDPVHPSGPCGEVIRAGKSAVRDVSSADERKPAVLPKLIAWQARNDSARVQSDEGDQQAFALASREHGSDSLVEAFPHGGVAAVRLSYRPDAARA
jgi:hypothetical protein